MSKNGRQVYDWDSIRQEYIVTDITIKQLAEKLNIRHRTVADKSRKEGWVQQRIDYREKVASKVTSHMASKTAKATSDSLAKINNNVQAAVEEARRLLENGVSASQLEHILNSMKMAEELTRRFERNVTITQEHKMHIESERLKMDQQKAEAFNPENEIVIRIDGFEKEWAE